MNKKLFPNLILAGSLILVAIFAPYLTPFDPYVQDLEGALTPPNSVNLLGTDRYGRDVLSRVIMGSRTTLCAALLLLLTISVVGSLIGAVCGFSGGKLDKFLMRVSDIFWRSRKWFLQWRRREHWAADFLTRRLLLQ